tara:strand:+ start:565 stop:984 length:420 start_codon:yes stop_codon:yes gene_type:complete
MKITRRQLRQIIKEEVEGAKIKAAQALQGGLQGSAEKALNKIVNDAQTLSNLVRKGEVSVDIGDAKVTIKAEEPPVLRALQGLVSLPTDQIAKKIKTDVTDLDIIVQKRIGKNKRFVGNITDPFNPKSRGFKVSFKGKW